MFADMGEAFAQQRLAWRDCELRRVPLNLSFRAVEPLLAAVDGVFADHARTPGLTCSGDADPACRPSRRARGPDRDLADREGGAGQAGRALVAAGRGNRVLAGGAAGGAHRPDHPRLARSPARCWPPRTGPIRAGDILILVRKRTPFAPAMISALKARGIKVAGADRLVLTEQIAVQDLMALGDFLCLPEDDLALASVLKSPLFGLDDDDLLALAPKRQGFLWQELVARAGTRCALRRPRRDPEALAGAGRPGAAVRVLLRPAGRGRHARADAGAPRRRGGRRHRRAAQPGAGLRRERRAVPAGLPELAARGHPRHQARHGAGARRGARHDRARRQGPGGADRVPARHLLDAIGAAAGQPRSSSTTGRARPTRRRRSCGRSRAPATSAPVQQAKAAIASAEAEERNRLLYVALTRARDRLYVAGFEGSNAPPRGLLVQSHQRRPGRPAGGGDEPRTGRVVWRIASAQTAKPEAAKAHAPASAGSRAAAGLGEEGPRRRSR